MKIKVRFSIYLPLLFLFGFLWCAALFYNKTQDYRLGYLEYQKLRTESVQKEKIIDRQIGSEAEGEVELEIETESKVKKETEGITEKETEKEAERGAETENEVEKEGGKERGKEAERKTGRKAENETEAEREAESATGKEAIKKTGGKAGKKVTRKIETDAKENKVKLFSIKEEILKQYNPDYVFWLSIPDTSIDYPVVRSAAPDYYLNHTFQKQENSSGCLFIQSEEGEERENIVIYGHNRKDGSMFGALKKYEAAQFYGSHPRLWIYSKGRWYQGEIFSCQLKGKQDLSCYQTEFKDRQDKKAFLKNMKQESLYPIPVYPALEDSVITLSTCYGSSKRMIVQAVLMCYTE